MNRANRLKRWPAGARGRGTRILAVLWALAWVLAAPEAAGQEPGPSRAGEPGPGEEGEPVPPPPRSQGHRRCLFCHGREDFRGKVSSDGRHRLFVDEDEFQHSIHGRRMCWECHADADVIPHRPGLERVECVRCHYVGNTAGAPQTRKYKEFRQSVHGRLAEAGDPRAPLCQDCHGTHEVRPPDDPTSRVHRRNIPEDCGRCHARALEEYRSGLHGRLAGEGNLDAPVCTDCHSEHQILRPTDPESSVSPTHIPEACARCHEDQQVMDRYGIDVAPVRTFRTSFHGVALKFGMTRVANCTSCHEHHAIFSPDDPRSTVHRDNLPRTCGQSGCHPGASANFARGRIHIAAHEESAGVVYRVAQAFKWLTIIVMSGLLLHILLDLFRRVRNRRAGRGSDPSRDRFGEDASGATARLREVLDTPVQRLDVFVRVQHGFMAVSVIFLIITGIPVKFHDAGWAKDLMDGVGGLEVTSLIHRLAAIMLMAVSAAHLFYIAATGPGRRNFRHMLPRFSDVRDFVHNIAYFLGIRRERPRFDRFSYLEKFDYWAVYWGIVVMVGSGLVLWFETDAMRFIPKEWVDVAKEMHSDEAMLATLAIVLWHFFNAHFNPDKFPMNKVFWHGRTTIGEMLEEHPRELAAMLRRGTLDRARLEKVAYLDPRIAEMLDEVFPDRAAGDGGEE